jgi:hypothetical protein
MFRKFTYVLTLFLAIVLPDASAQNSQVMYYMNLPQNHLLNPALRPSNSFYFGIPVLGGVNVNINNNFVNLSDIFIPGKADSIISFLHPDYNVDDFLKKLKKRNFLAPEVNIQLFGLGFNAGEDLYIFLDVNERVDANIVVPGDLLKLAFKGNQDFLGKTIDLSTLDAELKYYREFGLGFSKNFGNNLRIGAKAKILFGIASFSLDNRSLGLTVNNDFTHTINADLSANFSGPVTIHMDANNRPDKISIDESIIKSTGFFLNSSNMGLGIDFGAVYKISDKIQVSASIIDLGYIKWKSDITNLKAESQFLFSGFNIKDVVDGTKTFDDLANEMLDSLKNSITITDTNTPFKTFLPTGISIGGSFNLTKSIALGILSHSVIAGKQFRQAVTMSANVNLGNAFSTSLCYTAENHRYDNLGAGLAFRTGIVQFYLIADKIPVYWNKIITDNSSIPLPARWNTINLRLGLNLVIGNKIKKKNDKPMLIEQK